MAETYDGGIIIQLDSLTPNGPIYLIKYTLEGRELWKKEIKNTYSVPYITPTKDSGFIMATPVNSYPKDTPTPDSSFDISILKFDKCGHLQWGKYVPAIGYNAPSDIIENNGNFYLNGQYINSGNNAWRKPITILKFNKFGGLMGYHSFEGDGSNLFLNTNKDTIYLAQDLYIPIGTDTGTYYLFSGIQSLDTNLQTINKRVIGYDSNFNGLGPLVVKQNKIIALTKAAFLSGAKQQIHVLNLG